MASENVVKVNVKWGKQLFKDIEIDMNESPRVFKSQLWTLTSVSPDRQTIIGLRGGKLKEDSEWSKMAPKPGMTIMLMGTPDEASLQPAATYAQLVSDDLSAALSGAMDHEPPPTHPPGLLNLGNTCYMNATVQCLSAVPELRRALMRYNGRSLALDQGEKFTASIRELINQLGTKGTVSHVSPHSFLYTLRHVNPQFAERGPHGRFMQQDAEECFSEILSRLATTLKLTSQLLVSDGPAITNEVDSAFAIRIKSTDTCEDSESDESITRVEHVRMLKCHISSQVNHLSEGIREGLEERIEKESEKLGRSATWKRSSKIDRIPPYLIVQFVRFFWKSQEQVKAKILRNVSFPINLDVYNFCTDELKAKLDVHRQASRAADSVQLSDGGPKDTPRNGPASRDVSGPGAASSSSVAISSPIVAEGIPNVSTDHRLSADTGNYELCAVLTHQGRAADSGHYVAWVLDQGTTWYKFDDDTVSVQTEDDVKKLSGGGDWHMAYICLYRAKK